MIYFNFTLGSPAIVAGSSGNLTNRTVLTINDTRFHPAFGTTLGEGAGGPLCEYYMDTGGGVTINATVPNITLAIGSGLSFGGAFLASNSNV
jgi:hypothetical protein